MTRTLTRLHTRAHLALTHRERGMEGLQVAISAAVLGGAALILFGLISGKMQEIWAQFGG